SATSQREDVTLAVDVEAEALTLYRERCCCARCGRTREADRIDLRRSFQLNARCWRINVVAAQACRVAVLQCRAGIFDVAEVIPVDDAVAVGILVQEAVAR